MTIWNSIPEERSAGVVLKAVVRRDLGTAAKTTQNRRPRLLPKILNSGCQLEQETQHVIMSNYNKMRGAPGPTGTSEFRP